MRAPQVETNRHLNAPHQSAPLLLQFLFSALIQVFQHFQEIQQHLQEEQLTPSQLSLLRHFSGLSPHRTTFFYESAEGGSLSKLAFYATSFCEHTQMRTHDFNSLAKNCRDCLLLGTQLFKAAEEKNCHATALYGDRLRRRLMRVAKDLTKATLILQRHEDVLFFLLRHIYQIDSILGPGATHQLLKKAFPAGLLQARDDLIKKYTARGFIKQAETIRQHFHFLS